jgi:pSer/pThr/pTyr-binding forkhead associated (FHA) protein
LPEGKSITVSVVDGPSKGLERNLTQPLATIGRLGGGADIELDDRQVSRLHCALEVKDHNVLLRDLRSTNGTYVADQRILSAKLELPSDFRIGGTTLRVTVAPHDS